MRDYERYGEERREGVFGFSVEQMGYAGSGHKSMHTSVP